MIYAHLLKSRFLLKSYPLNSNFSAVIILRNRVQSLLSLRVSDGLFIYLSEAQHPL